VETIILGVLNRLFGAGSFGKMWSACGQHEIQCARWMN